MKSKRLGIAAVVLVLAVVAGYWYYSPNVVLYRMQQAAIQGDTDAVNDHIDYPALRESLRGQMAAAMTGSMGEAKDNPFAALGGMLAMAMINPLVDALVRPEVVANAIKTGRMKRAEAGAGAGAEPSAKSEPSHKIRWAIERKGMDRVIARPKDEGGTVAPDSPGFVFERRGFADWRLTEVRMQLPK